MAPGIHHSLIGGVVIAHRLGPIREHRRARAIIILFTFHHVRDAVWQAARRCKFLDYNSLCYSYIKGMCPLLRYQIISKFY